MNDKHRSEFEDQARRVGRRELPREWRDEILGAALGDGEDPGAAGAGVVALDPAGDPGIWEGRVRKAERRALWSMAACLVLTLVLAALLIRPRSESIKVAHWMETGSGRAMRSHSWEMSEGSESEEPGTSIPGVTDRSAKPSPPPSDDPADVVDLIGGTERGFFSRPASVEDTSALRPSEMAKSESSDHGDQAGAATRRALAEITATLREINEDPAGNPAGPGPDAALVQNRGARARFKEVEDASRRGISLGRQSSTGGEVGGGGGTREEFEDGEWTYRPDSSSGDELVKDKSGDRFETGLANGAEPAPKRPVRKRRPFVVAANSSNNTTEEVRYQIDTKDLVGDIETTREIGVTVGMTPTTDKTKPGGKDQVAIETKVLRVNAGAAERVDADWSEELGATGVPVQAVGRLNSLLGIEGSGAAAAGSSGAGDGTIVLSPEQTNGVLKALAGGGIVKQVSNPTLVTEDNELARISLIDRVPIITTTINQPEAPKPEPEVPEPLPEEPEKDAKDEPWSTFSLNVSDVSFKLAKAALARGEWPAPDQVRVEEFVNAFDYGDPAPKQEEKVACNLEQAAHPFMQQRNLLRVSMKTAALGRAAGTPLRLTVLLDNSGSMDRSDRVESVKNAFQLLASQLTSADQLTLIGFARTPRLLADRMAGNQVAKLAGIVDSTPSAGGTNIEEALRLGIEKAREQLLEGAQNRIILLTDGAVNLGNAEPEDLAELVALMRANGIAFDACGVGSEGLNDKVLEALTRQGDGRYYFLDRPEDADDGFARQIAGALRPAARNVKVQVRFNPNRVGRYKLLGFRKHRLKKEDFRNDSVDAAELAAAEAGNAIYQFEPLPQGSGDIGTVSVRFQDAESGRMIEREWPIPYVSRIPRLEEAAASLRLASAAALLGEKLLGSQIGESVDMARLGKLVNSLPSEVPSDQRVRDLVEMTNQAREMGGE